MHAHTDLTMCRAYPFLSRKFEGQIDHENDKRGCTKHEPKRHRLCCSSTWLPSISLCSCFSLSTLLRFRAELPIINVGHVSALE